MLYAEVAVNSPAAQRRSFCYSVPPQIDVTTGQAVWVPFGPRTLQGIIVKLSDYPSFETTKDIAGVISTSPLLSSARVELALWMSEHYLAPLFDCISMMLPPGFERKFETFLQRNPQSDVADINGDQKRILDMFEGKARISLKDVQHQIGKAKADKAAGELVRRKILFKIEELTDARVKPKIIPFLRLNFDPATLQAVIDRLKQKKAARQIEVVEFLAGSKGEVKLPEVKEATGADLATIKSLIKNNLVVSRDVETRRDPLARYHITPALAPELTLSQETVHQDIISSLTDFTPKRHPDVFLLEGVTGSGKTEIYLRALEKAISLGKKGICLVPEISLTPQTIQRFAARFPGKIAVYHSGLTPGEQFDEWRRIARGECDVVIGPRSALFAPQPELGLIIIDEEHEWTYKQVDKSPRYDARTAALKLAEYSGATVVMGSATPDVESYYRAQRGEFHLVNLRERITVRGLTEMPQVEVVDLREELKSGNRSIFSRSLLTALAQTLNKKEQAILFLNRRGTANFARCMVCGYMVKCPRCLISMTYHSPENRLICHHCGYKTTVPEICPQCFRPKVRLFGVGTQKVEDETQKLFPGARILRWDSDITGKTMSHEEIMQKLVNHETDILIGTQMVAKGLDLPLVTLVGVISADTGLNLPDFRAPERVFQLTCQIAGRTGRGMAVGKAIVQTYSPENYAIQAAAKHDYASFYEKEIEYRRTLSYPPFTSMANLIFHHTNEQACHNEAVKMLDLLNQEKDRKGIPDMRFIGPSPSFIPRLRGYYRWQLIVCGRSLPEFLNEMTFPRGWVIDIDPVSVL
jgi:primosomal protein N' (replication factor Y) (superfamily II helicase)